MGDFHEPQFPSVTWAALKTKWIGVHHVLGAGGARGRSASPSSGVGPLKEGWPGPEVAGPSVPVTREGDLGPAGVASGF